MSKFRFQDLEIWQISIEIADRLFDISRNLEERKLFRFAEQLRGAGMSMRAIILLKVQAQIPRKNLYII